MMASGIATLPMSCSAAACVGATAPRRRCRGAGDLVDELGDAVVVVAEVGVALGERAHQHVAGLAAGGGAARVLLRVHGRVGLRSASVASRCRAG